MFLLTIYLPWLLNMLPYSYWALTCDAALPAYSAFMISVRQASDLPPASFRFPVTRDTLALGYILPAVGWIRDFHPLKHAPAGRTSTGRLCTSAKSPCSYSLIFPYSPSPCSASRRIASSRSASNSASAESIWSNSGGWFVFLANFPV